VNEAYVQRVARLVERLAPLVAERDLSVRRVGAQLVLLRLDLRFLDGRRFEGNEVWTAEGRRYRFHLQNEAGGLIWRFDNAPHHPEVSTHPHHEHLASGRVVPASEITLEELLGEPGRWSGHRTR
jgi:hypothetical protein